MIKRKLLTSLLTFVVTAAWALSPMLAERYNVAYLNLHNGLPSNNITDMFEDSHGFVWFATYGGGLVRTDGYGYMTPKLDLQSNSCKSVTEDAFNRLWVAFDEGLNVIDLKTLNTVRPVAAAENRPPQNELNAKLDRLFEIEVVKAYCDTRKAVWIVTRDEIIRLTFNDKGEVETYAAYHYVGNTPDICIVDVESNGNPWVSVDGGLYRLRQNGNSLVREEVDPVLRSLSICYITDIMQYDSRVWISSNQGLFAYNAKEHTLRRFVSDGKAGSLSHIYTTCLEVSPQGEMIVGSLGGVNVYDRTTETFYHWTTKTEHVGLCSDFVHCILVRQGQMWVGTESSGVTKLSPRPLLLRNYTHKVGDAASLSPNPVNAICVDDEGTIWVGTVEGGLNRKALGQEAFTHITSANSTLTHNSVSALTLDAHRQLWIGTWGGGVNYLSLDNPGKIEHLNLPTSFEPITQYIGSLVYDPYNNGLWIGSNDGIFFYDFKTQQIANPFEGNQTIRGCIGAAIDRDGQLWMGCITGVVAIDLKKGPDANGNFTMRGLRSKLDQPKSRIVEKMSCIFLASDGTLWFGSNGYGLYKRELDKEGKEVFRCFTKRDGLASNAVKGIAEDKDGILWIATANGLSAYNPRRNYFTNYDVADGLLSAQFYWNGAISDKGGRLYFGTVAGMIELNGENSSAGQQGRLSFTRLVVDNEEVWAGSKYLDEDISLAKKIKMYEGNRSFDIDFSALTYGGETQGVYSYRLVGYDQDWIRLEAGVHSVHYTSLPSGNYRLEVRYMSPFLAVEDTVISIDIEMVPYFWKSWWFITLLAIVVGCTLLYIYRRHMAAVKAREVENVLAPLRDVISDSDNPFELQSRIQSMLNAQERYRESTVRTAEEDLKAAQSEGNTFMEKVTSIMEANCMNSEFDVTQFCQLLGMSKSVVSKRMKEETGLSTGQFIRDYRLKVAKTMLLNTDGRNVTEIAYKCGFNDPKYFTRCFTKQFGVAPSAYLHEAMRQKKEEGTAAE